MSKTAPRTIYLVPARAVGRIQNPVTQVPRPVLPRGGHVAQPQPLVGTRQCLKRPAPSPPVSDPIEQLLGEHTGPCPPRKRERLNHLTAEEKLNRRKMKNRVAAQTARDRKKVRSQRLEDVVRQLLEENTLLREENKRLREQQHQFQKMEPQQEQRKEMAFESAAFISGPQPRVQHELDRIIQDLKSDFDVDQLASELPYGEDSFVEETSVRPFAEPTSPMEPSVLTVPCSPSSSSTLSHPSPSPSSSSTTWFCDEPPLADPMLSECTVFDVAHEETLWGGDIFESGVDPLSPLQPMFDMY